MEAARALLRAFLVLDGLTRQRREGATEALARITGISMALRTAAYGRAAFSWALKRGTVQSNPFRGLTLPRRSKARGRV